MATTRPNRSPAHSISTASMPSTLVPDIRPIKYRPRFGSVGCGAWSGTGETGLGGSRIELSHQRRSFGMEPRDRLPALQRHAAGQLHGDRIDVDAIHAEFVVQMRTGGEAGHADETY